MINSVSHGFEVKGHFMTDHFLFGHYHLFWNSQTRCFMGTPLLCQVWCYKRKSWKITQSLKSNKSCDSHVPILSPLQKLPRLQKLMVQSVLGCFSLYPSVKAMLLTCHRQSGTTPALPTEHASCPVLSCHFPSSWAPPGCTKEKKPISVLLGPQMSQGANKSYFPTDKRKHLF